ncbi:hypothetical protein MalM25_16840 [Planctomycetes bacterium MalM25]|nr:hypothetical protein MalM25_16840 [Planctomycetes bacterium MalM25]
MPRQMIRYACVAPLLLAVLFVATTSTTAQTTLYDGSQPLNFFSSARLNDDLMLNNNPANATRNGIVQSGADPNVLEQGDAALFKTADRRMATVDAGSARAGTAGMAVGAPAQFVTNSPGTGVADTRGAGLGYVVFDEKTTTGLQTLDFSFYYNDPTPNTDSTNTVDNVPENLNFSGGNIAVRIFGIQSTGALIDPWANDDFQLSAGDANAGASVASGQYRDMDSGGAEPVVEQLLFKQSQFDLDNPDTDIFLPSDEWQSDSLVFDLGDGYDFLFIAVAGVTQDNVAPAERWGFGDISYDATTPPDGDYNADGIVDAADYTVWRDGNSPDSSQAGYDLWAANYGTSLFSTATATAAAIPEPASVLMGLLAAVGCVASGRRR